MYFSLMIKILYIIIFSLIVTNCAINEVTNHHGVPYLKKKQSNLIIDKTNKNDIIKILGTPSTKSKFDNDIWIYIERKEKLSKLSNLGKMEIYKNDILVLEINQYGILKKKEFFNKDNMQKIKLVDATTENVLRKNTFIYDFMSSMRQKINDPLGVRAKKRKEISQR